MINSTIKTAQERLNALGYNLGVDGVLGPKTKTAIKLYQAENRLPITGTLNGDTLSSLLKPQAAQVPQPRLRPPPADVMSGGRPSPAPGVPPTPQMRPGDGQPPVALGQGRTYPGGVPLPTPRPQPGLMSPINPASDDAAFAGMRTASALTPPPSPTPQQQTPPQPAPPQQGPAPDGTNRFAPPPPAVQAALNRTYGDQAASAAWRRSLPPVMGGIQTGGMGMPGLPQMGFGNSPGRTNQAPMSVQSGPRGVPPPTPPTPDQLAAAKASLAARLQQMQQPQTAQAQPSPGFTPTPGNPGMGIPGLPPSPDFPSAVSSAAGAAGNVARQLFGVQPAYGGQSPAQASPASQLPLAWAPGGVQASQMAAAKQQFRDSLWKALLGARIGKTYGPGVTSTLQAPASPPMPPLRYP